MTTPMGWTENDETRVSRNCADEEEEQEAMKLMEQQQQEEEEEENHDGERKRNSNAASRSSTLLQVEWLTTNSALPSQRFTTPKVCFGIGSVGSGVLEHFAQGVDGEVVGNIFYKGSLVGNIWESIGQKTMVAMPVPVPSSLDSSRRTMDENSSSSSNSRGELVGGNGSGNGNENGNENVDVNREVAREQVDGNFLIVRIEDESTFASEHATQVVSSLMAELAKYISGELAASLDVVDGVGAADLSSSTATPEIWVAERLLARRGRACFPTSNVDVGDRNTFLDTNTYVHLHAERTEPEARMETETQLEVVILGTMKENIEFLPRLHAPLVRVLESTAAKRVNFLGEVAKPWRVSHEDSSSNSTSTDVLSSSSSSTFPATATEQTTSTSTAENRGKRLKKRKQDAPRTSPPPWTPVALESGNLISGIRAALLTECELLKVPTVMLLTLREMAMGKDTVMALVQAATPVLTEMFPGSWSKVQSESASSELQANSKSAEESEFIDRVVSTFQVSEREKGDADPDLYS